MLVADDENVVRDGVVAILSYQSDMKVVAEAADGLQAVELARQHKPDLVLLDLKMPRLGGLEAIPKLVAASPKSSILVLTGFAETDGVYQSIKAGARGFLLKDATRAQLLQAIRDVANGLESIQPAIAMRVIHEINHPAEIMYTANPLAPRELQVLKLLAQGMSNKEIARAMVVSERTIAKYVSEILSKLHLASRTQAALYAVHEGLAEKK
ncbi:MAG: response regulator transcription factor [Anaerolineales bacterium]|nr:response regulator transcription factor [Anaerolineales bacterium]